MNKCLLSIIGLAAVAVGANAQATNYEWDFLGQPTGVSDNGQYVTIIDEEDFMGYVWNADAPNTPQRLQLPDGRNFCPGDATNDGMIVGYVVNKDSQGTTRPAIYRNGEYTMLPVNADVLNTAEANEVTPDGKIIAGTCFMFDATADQGGRYYPVHWVLNDAGEYVFKPYNNVKLPNHQGFIVETQSVDGQWIAGRLYCGMGSEIPAIIHGDSLLIFNNLETKYEKWMYKGKYYAGVDEATGKQIWVTDENDPRIVLFAEEYIDGFHDGNEDKFLTGEFIGVDRDLNFYGHRSHVNNVDADFNADITHTSSVYNAVTGEWTDYDGYNGFSCGRGTELIFTADKMVIQNGEAKALSEIGVTSKRSLSGISHMSDNGQVLAGVSIEYHPASGDPMAYPLIAVLENELVSGVKHLDSALPQPKIRGEKGSIAVDGASNVAVYSITGALVSTSAQSNVPTGIYIVKADNKVAKVIVR